MILHVSPSVSQIFPQISYIFKLLSVNKRLQFELLESDDKSAPTIGNRADNTLRISDHFLCQQLTTANQGKDCFFSLENGQRDYIASAFFFVTSLQEYQDADPDPLGRFRYKNSYQYKFQNTGVNLVQHCFDQIAASLGIEKHGEKTSFFLSHDIDSVYGSIFEDGYHLVKNGRIDTLMKMLLYTAIGKPSWLNMDHIMKIESAYDVRSTFFWIVNKGRSGSVRNADYRFRSAVVQRQFSSTGKNGFENGLHKSTAPDTFDEELRKYGHPAVANRYHYLKFNLPAGYDRVEECGLKIDASLGFSERIGFRNNYGLPFNPFNFREMRPYKFVEVPLHVMDRTFFNDRADLKQAEKQILNFLDANKTDCVLSILWHNNFFSEYKYKGYLSLYKTILSYIKENGFKSVNQEEIINKYSITWP